MRRAVSAARILVVMVVLAGCGSGDSSPGTTSEADNDFLMATNTTTIGLRLATCGVQLRSYRECAENEDVQTAVGEAEDNGFVVELDLAREAFSLDVSRDERSVVFGMDVEGGRVKIRCRGDSQQCRPNGEFGVDGGALETLERVLRTDGPGAGAVRK